MTVRAQTSDWEATASKRLELIKWVTKAHNDEWDKRMSRDSAEGKLDFLSKEGKEAKLKVTLRRVRF